jgi:outer membrane receptor protein involved in Fe transport
LRGLNATTLYGSQGRNGVILVTTKGGAKQKNKFQASLSQSYFVIEAVVPEYQNKWGNGFDGSYGEFFSNWGSLFDGKAKGFRHPYWEHRNLFPEYPEFQIAADSVLPGQTTPGFIPTAAPNNVADFFEKGHSATTSLSLGASSQLGSMNFTFSHTDEAGFIKFNDLVRDNFGLGGITNLTEKLTLNASFNFARSDFQTPPTGVGQGSNAFGGPHVFANLLYTPRNIDLMNWPYENPVTHASVYYRNGNDMPNPRWTLHNARQTNITNRFFSSTGLKYDLTDWLNVMYRLGIDTYAEDQSYYVNKGGTGFAAAAVPGLYRTVSGNNTLLDHSLLVSFNKQLSGTFHLDGLLGYNYRDNEYEQQGLESLGQVVYGLLEHRNFTSSLPRDFNGANLNYQINSAIQGVFVEANLAYKEFLYVKLNGRNDWSSTLEEENRSQFYPGASVSFLPTAAFPNFAADALDFVKLRFAYGTSAAFPQPYTTRPSLTLNSQARIDGIGNVVTSSLPSLLANPNLEPELLKETEFGIEIKALQNKIRLDFSYYNRIADGQIVQRDLDPATGYNSTFINAGKIVNKGIEASLWGTPVKSRDINLDLGINFTRNRSKVEDLPEGSTEILVAGFSDLGNFAIEGQPMNVIKGSFVEKSPDGELIVNEAGDYKQANDIGIIADPNPDWLGSAIMAFTWKGLSFGMQWDYVHGGQMYAYSAATMVGRGVAKELESFDPTLPLILPGVREITDVDGNVTGYTPNTLPLTTSGVFFTNTIIGGSPDDRGVYDATRVRFREVSLGYDLPTSVASKVKMKGINITLLGSNLWFRAINAPKYARADFDRTPFGTGNGAGFDYLSGPSSRRYGVNLRLTF